MLSCWVAGAVVKSESQVAAPESMEQTRTEMPWEAAWEKRESQDFVLARPVLASQLPKLMFMTGSLRVFTSYSAAVKMPPPLLGRTTRSAWAEGATPRTRWTSIVASDSSPPPDRPGSGPAPGTMVMGRLAARPVLASNSEMSVETTRERPMMATRWPAPVKPARYGVLRSKMLAKSPGVT